MKDKNFLFLVAIVLLVFSIINIWWEVLSNTWLRLFTSGIFLLAAMRIVGLKKLLGLSIFVLLMLCDFLLVEWEVKFAPHGYFSLHSLIMLFLLFLTIRELEWPKISWFEILSALLFFFVNSLVIWSLRDYFKTDDMVLEILFLVNSFLTILLVVFAFFMSINLPNDSSAFFFFGILALVVSELILFSIYFMELELLRYVDNVFYVLGLFFLLRASLNNKILKENGSIPGGKEEKKKKPTDPKDLKTYR